MAERRIEPVGAIDVPNLTATRQGQRVEIHTARRAYVGSDRVDVRVGTLDPVGKLFEPPPELRGCGGRAYSQRGWDEIRARYTDRARASYRIRRDDWLALRHKASITLVCDCAHPDTCLASVAAELLSRALPGLSILRGERKALGVTP